MTRLPRHAAGLRPTQPALIIRSEAKPMWKWISNRLRSRARCKRLGGGSQTTPLCLLLLRRSKQAGEGVLAADRTPHSRRLPSLLNHTTPLFRRLSFSAESFVTPPQLQCNKRGETTAKETERGREQQTNGHAR